MATKNVKKERSTDRILVLKPIEGEKVKSSKGLIDPRLFTGENELHAIQDRQTTLWYFKYRMGGLPEALKQQFTNFPKLLTFATGYFKNRGVEIKEVLDKPQDIFMKEL